MSDEIDAGPIYMKREMSLEGKAQHIYERMSSLAMEMAEDIVDSQPSAIPQEGQPLMFERRRPAESELRDVNNIKELYDHIRMLDADGYPHAFLSMNGLRIEFTNASCDSQSVTASAKIFFEED
tara:strand:- start:885 stop:1256 length:372 start_codon:yes stop_codon:yes gene_type:complete